MDKYHCTQNPVTKLRFTTCNLFIYLPLCYLPGYLENCVYFHIVFFFVLSGWLSTWNSWICGSLYWYYWQAEECSFSSENLNCSLPHSLLQRGEWVKSAGFLLLCLSCRFVRNSSLNLFSSKRKLNLVGFTIFRGHINTHDKVSRKPAKIEFAKGCKQKRDLYM